MVAVGFNLYAGHSVSGKVDETDIGCTESSNTVGSDECLVMLKVDLFVLLVQKNYALCSLTLLGLLRPVLVLVLLSDQG